MIVMTITSLKLEKILERMMKIVIMIIMTMIEENLEKKNMMILKTTGVFGEMLIAGQK